MQPNNGTVVRDLRILTTGVDTGKQHWYWWLVSLATGGQGDADKLQYTLRVTSVETSEELAIRTFDRAREATRAREVLIAVLSQSDLDSTDPDGVQELLDLV